MANSYGTNFFRERINPSGDTEYVALADEKNDVLLCRGETTPTNGDAGYAPGCSFIDTDASATAVLYLNEGSNTSCDFNVINPAATNATAYDDIGNPDASGSIQFTAYTGTYTSTTANWGGLILTNTHANPTAGASLLNLDYTANGDAHGIFIDCTDTVGTASQFKVGADGNTVITGTATGTDALTLTAGDITVTSGDVTMTAGDLLLTLGGLTLTAGDIVNTLGDLTLTEGDLLMTTGDLDLTDGSVKISKDNELLTLGADDATDSYIKFDGSNLIFYDSDVASEATLAQLLTGLGTDPTVTGDLTITEGKFNWTDGVD